MTHLERERENYPGMTDEEIIQTHCPYRHYLTLCDMECDACWNEEAEP